MSSRVRVIIAVFFPYCIFDDCKYTVGLRTESIVGACIYFFADGNTVLVFLSHILKAALLYKAQKYINKY